MRRLDIDGDSRITYNEFVEALSPVSPDLIPVGKVTTEKNDTNLD